jgi:hypothetical protein
MQLHTSTRSELNLIKSVIYIYIYNLFYILYFKPYFITFFKEMTNLTISILILSFIKSTKIKAFLINFIIIDKTSYEFVLENTISTPDDFNSRRKDYICEMCFTDVSLHCLCCCACINHNRSNI